MRQSIDGLATLVEKEAGLSSFSQIIFVFCNRKRDKIKLLLWENNGFILWYKRLEKFHFKWPGNKTRKGHMGLTYTRKLYRIEQTVKESPVDKRKRTRQE